MNLLFIIHDRIAVQDTDAVGNMLIFLVQVFNLLLAAFKTADIEKVESLMQEGLDLNYQEEVVICMCSYIVLSKVYTCVPHTHTTLYPS